MLNRFRIIKYNSSNEDTVIKKLISSFSCGNLIIDNFLKGNEALDPSMCVTYLFTMIDSNDQIVDLIGYFSLCTDAMLEKTEIFKVGKVFNGSAIRIHMFAIDKKFQQLKIDADKKSRTFASTMLINCMAIIKKFVKENVGAAYIVLNSTKEGQNLYTHTGGFENIDDDYITPIHENEIECVNMYKPIFDIY